jgi:hypothetical protein
MDRLYEEVHVIALHYHWPEAAILALPASRRRRYLGQLARHVQRAPGAAA